MLFITKFIAIIIGSLFLVIGINFFLVPFKVIDGGVIGIALIAKYMWGLKTGLTIILCSIPIYIVAWVRYRNFFFSSLHGMLVFFFYRFPLSLSLLLCL
jgi:uncharacterized membrane-anchored protein YitT (DUF2179 family)